jgi:hypothetical protein
VLAVVRYAKVANVTKWYTPKGRTIIAAAFVATFDDIEHMAFPRLVGVAGVARGALTPRPA